MFICKRSYRHVFTLFLSWIVFGLIPSQLSAQRTVFSPEEYIRRRAELMDKVDDGLIILFAESRYEGSSGLNPGAHFRQDNDFFYYTGNEDPHSILVLVPGTQETFLFLPRQSASEIRADGPNWLQDVSARERTGLSDIYGLSYFEEFLARRLNRSGNLIHMRLTPRGTQLAAARRDKTLFNARLPLDYHRIKTFRERMPTTELKDITPAIDSMRLIKSREEIEVVRRVGRISAEGVKQAMLATRPGGFEYEVEAAAMCAILKHGAQGAAYPPIVAAGINACTLHYTKNSKRLEAGEIILMDFGGDLDYLMADISRSWPVSGKFTPEQKKIYNTILEVQKACIEAYRPGATVEDVQNHVAEMMKRKDLSVPKQLAHCGLPGKPGTIGHYVGMTVHDVGKRNIPLQPGMVITIEPALYYPEKSLGIRIEDTILITEDGCEVLTKDVPKEVDEIENLMKRRKNK